MINRDNELLASIQSMGNMHIVRICGIEFGIEQWGAMKPAQMTTADGRIFRPFVFGIWLRVTSREDKVG